MTTLASGLFATGHYEDALSVQEAELATLQRVGASEERILVAQNNLAATYARLRHFEQALRLKRDVYSGYVKLYGEDHRYTLEAANNLVTSLLHAHLFEEAKSLLLKTMPVARRTLGENDETTLRFRANYAEALCKDPAATLDDLREAVTTLEEIERTARRVLGGAHPITKSIETSLRKARAALRAREPK
jgi:hypothetical protein